jgi:hypothetical protein
MTNGHSRQHQGCGRGISGGAESSGPTSPIRPFALPRRDGRTVVRESGLLAGRGGPVDRASAATHAKCPTRAAVSFTVRFKPRP